MKIQKFGDGKLYIKYKFNPSEDLLSTPDQRALDPDDDLTLLLDGVISLVDSEMRTVIIGPNTSEVAQSVKKKLRKAKTKRVKFSEIKEFRLEEKKKKSIENYRGNRKHYKVNLFILFICMF